MKNNTPSAPENSSFSTWKKNISQAKYPAPVRGVLNNLVDLMEARGYKQAETARKIKHGPHKRGISAAALNQLLNGTYGADPIALTTSIETFLNIETGRAIFRDGGFIHTRLFQKITELADIANTTQRITCLHGGNFAGKSVNAEALHIQYNRASTIFVTCPYGDSYGGFVKRLAAVLGLTPKGTVSVFREAILEALDERHLLIIDEFHQPVISYSYSQSLRVMGFIREINDLCRCGVLLVGNSEGFETIRNGIGYEALADRIILGYNIAGKGFDLRPAFGDNGHLDIEEICKAYDLPKPGPEELEFCRALIEKESVGRFFDLLKISSTRAKRNQKRFAWADLIATNRALLKLN